MVEPDQQLRSYATWLMNISNERTGDSSPIEHFGSAPRPRRCGWLTVAAAVVVLVVGLAAVVRAPSDSPVSTTAEVTLAPGFEVPVIDGPADVAGLEVYQGAPAPPVESVAIEAMGGADEVVMAPIAPLDYPVVADFVDQGGEQLVTVGVLDEVAVAVHASSGPAGARCAVLSSTTVELANEFVSGCSTDWVSLSGPFGFWIVWPDLPAGTALVAVVDGNGPNRYQRPTGQTAAFNGAFGTATGLALVAYDAAGTELARQEVSPAIERDELTLALESSGVDLDAAPASVRSLQGAVWCGMEQRQGELTAETVLDDEARRCFLDRHRAAQSAVFVEEVPTIEGDPIVTVWQTSDDGSLEVHIDPSRDSYGAGRWSRQPCLGLTMTFPDRPEPVPASYFGCSSNDEAEPLAGGIDGPVVYASPSSSGEDALAVGIVTLVEGCLVLSDDSGAADPVALVWAAGTRWDPVTSEVLLPDGTRVPIGTSISAGGGYHAAGAISSFVTDPDALSQVAQCATAGDTGEVFVIQHPVDTNP